MLGECAKGIYSGSYVNVSCEFVANQQVQDSHFPLSRLPVLKLRVAIIWHHSFNVDVAQIGKRLKIPGTKSNSSVVFVVTTQELATVKAVKKRT
ncbi:MAG: hypothetical protein EZS28_022093, partial [Streblomastix strix]